MTNFWTLVQFELKKILKRKITWIAFGIVFLTMLTVGVYRVFVFDEVDGVRVSVHEQEMKEKEATKKLSGRLVNDELVEEARQAIGTENAVGYEQFYNDVAYIYSFYFSEDELEEIKASLDADSQELFYEIRKVVIEKSMSGQYLTEGEKNYWRNVLANEDILWEYDYSKGMQQSWVAVYTAIVLIALMIAVSLANLFADEHQKKTDQLVLCSRNGKRVLYAAKIVAGMLFTMASAGLVLLATAVPQLALFGMDGWNAPIQLFATTSMFSMTFGEMILYIYGVAMIASLLYAAITMCCSELFRNSTVAVLALIVVLVLVPMMVLIPYEYRVFSQIFELNPINVLAIWSATDYRLVPFFGGYLTVYQVAPILYVVLACGCIWLGSRAYRNYQVSGR